MEGPCQMFGGFGRFFSGYHNYIYTILCISGTFSNMAIVLVLLRPSMRNNPFNLLLLAIALCDMTLMSSYFVFKQIRMCHPLYFTKFWIIMTYLYAVFSVFLHSVSLWLTVNMAILRYLVLKFSATSNASLPRLMTYKAAGVAIALAVLTSFCGSCLNMLRYQIEHRGNVTIPDFCVKESSFGWAWNSSNVVENYALGQPYYWNCNWERANFWMAAILLKVVPCALLTIFMALLVRTLLETNRRRARLSHGNSAMSASSVVRSMKSTGSNSSKAQADRTTTMLISIVAIFLVTELPQGILGIKVGVNPAFHGAMTQLGDSLDVLSLINSSVNFILYATMSKLFRQEFMAALNWCLSGVPCGRFWKKAMRADSAQYTAAMPQPSTIKTTVSSSTPGNRNSLLLRSGISTPINMEQRERLILEGSEENQEDTNL
uniref:G_PROTEIN_RECEP_F1_2 domain-containing protein n=1 Tax=Panagrellus redivivus TaxID=6233 RepID=A0A7E4W320_PANRE